MYITTEVEIDEYEVLADVSTDALIEELTARGETVDSTGISAENCNRLAELMKYKTPDETLAFLDKLLFPR